MAESTDNHDDGRSWSHNPPVLNSRNKSSLPIVYIHRSIPKQLRNAKTHILEASNNHALAIISGFTVFTSKTELLTESITTIIHRTVCCYIIGLLGGEVNGNFSPSGCLINLYINNISRNPFFFDSESWTLLCISVIQCEVKAQRWEWEIGELRPVTNSGWSTCKR